MPTESIFTLFYDWPQHVAPARTRDLVNDVKLKDVLDEIGAERWAEVRRIIQQLYDIPVDSIRLRLAASPVVRGESQLHGISVPRFAIRGYLPVGGFIHVRRVQLMLDMLPTPLRDGPPTLPPPMESFVSMTVRKWEQRFLDESQEALADCILPPPIELRKDYNFLRGNFGFAYGESSTTGVPYVTMLAHFGGAACIQACMVMSTLLISLSTRRQSNSANVPAAAEMGNPLKLNKEEWLGFTGMLRGDAIESVAAAGDRVGRYFNRNNGSALIAPLQHRLASLVNAQLPSVCFVNAGVLWSEDSEAQTYKFPWRANDRPRNTAQFADHAVLVAGVSTDRNRFCLNDPSKYPFTIYSKRHLFEAMVNGEFCVVYPPEVRVGLYQGMYSAKGSKPIFELGISEISDIAEKVSPSESARRASTMAGFSDKEYCLGRITLKPELHLELPNGDTIGLADFKRMGLESLARHSGRLSGKISGHWVWIEVRKSVDCITVWSAEQPASGLKRERLASIADPGWLLSTFRLAVLRKSTRTGEWTVKNNERLRDDAMKLDAAAADVSSMRRSASHVARSPFSELPPAKNFPEISLISSFAANGLATAVANWPRRHVDNCEMYAFMRPDATLIHSGKDCPPIQWMNLPDRRQQKRMAVRIADSIELIEKQHGYMPRIRAFATHFPEVARAVPDMSVNSLSTLVELARTLRDRRHSVSTIEVVAGSRILGLQPYRRPPKRGEPQEIICVAKVVPRPVDSGRVPSILSAIAEVVKFTELSASERLTFSIELEPGRYYELNDLQGICHLISAIDQHPLAKMLKPIVGLSVDIGHYAIAGILPSQLLGSKMDRVVHFHLSDHRGGHFVDLPIGDGGLGSQRGKAAFDPWLKFIYECYTTARADELPPLSGLVSLEMEAATSIVGLENSLKLMRKWFH